MNELRNVLPVQTSNSHHTFKYLNSLFSNPISTLKRYQSIRNNVNNHNKLKKKNIPISKLTTRTKCPKSEPLGMVVATMAWLSGATKTLHYRQIFSNHHHHHHHHHQHQKSSPSTLGILAFETAKTMSRLVSLYNSLTDHQIFKLRKEIMRSKGVTYLNSKDEGFLLNLACYERLEDLNQAAIAVSRLGQKCSDFVLNRFDIIYNELKHEIIDLGKLEFGTRNVHKIIGRMEKSIYSTANLHAALENLAELESSERKLERWKNTLGPKQMSNLEYVKEKIAFQNKQVQHYREISLWNQGFDKNVEHMARIVCVIYARICSIFGPYISDLPSLSKNTRPNSNHKKLRFWFHHQLDEELDYCLLEDRDKHGKPISRSGPIPNNSKKDKVRFFSHEMNQNSPDNKNRSAIKKNNGVFALAPPSTVGGSGLSLRYANIIIHAERCLYAPGTIGEDARQALYEMLPARLKTTVKRKLKRHWLKKEEASDVSDGYSMAEGWRDALEEIMGWLVPMAHDTVTWQAERNLERQKFDSKPTVLLLQTLHYSDLEMTEAAIIEVLVGLSCIYRYENRCLPGSGSASASVHMII